MFLIIQKVNVKSIHDNSTLIYLASFFLCFIPFFLPPVENTFRWIDLGFFYVQPGEYLKCATIILIAKYLSNHQLEVKENYIVIDYKSEKNKIKIQIKHGELFCELNDDDKYYVEQNIKNFYLKKLISILQDDDSSETNNCDFEKNKKQRTQ